MNIISRLFGKRLSSRCFEVFDTEDKFRKKYRKEFEILEDDEKKPGGVLLYDFSRYSHKLKGDVIVPFPICETQLQNTIIFRDWLYSIFERVDLDKEVVLQEVAPLLESHLNSYAEKLMIDKNISTDDREKLIRSWHEITTVLILDIFYKASTKAGGSVLVMRDILKRALWGISRCMEDLLYPKQRFSTSFIALYNLWGAQYMRMRSELLKNRVGLTEKQKALLNNDENKECFNLKYCIDFETPICQDKRPKYFYMSVEEKAMEFLESLFNDYIKRLRQSGIYDDVTTIRSIEEWKDITLREIERVSFIDIISTVLIRRSQSPLDDLRNATVTKEYYDRISNIKSLKAKCFSKINGMVEDYRCQIHDGCLIKSWSEKLLSVGINYRGMYSDMIKEKVIDPTFGYVAFEDAFRSANFAPLIESAIYMDSIKQEKGRPGLIKLLVAVIGESVGDDWYYSAAESIFPKYKEKDAKFAIEKLKKTKFIGIYAPRILEGRIPGYRYRA